MRVFRLNPDALTRPPRSSGWPPRVAMRKIPQRQPTLRTNANETGTPAVAALAGRLPAERALRALWVHRPAWQRHRGKAELRHDWFSGWADATFDSAHHKVTYSGARSTYKVEVKRITDSLDIEAIGERFAALETASGMKQLSVRDTTRATIGSAMFMVDYGRPRARGRVLLGDVLPFDRVWRTGANAATQFTTSARIVLGRMPLPPGTYTLWTVPHASGSVELIVNRQVWPVGHGVRSAIRSRHAESWHRAAQDTGREVHHLVRADEWQAQYDGHGVGSISVDGPSGGSLRARMVLAIFARESASDQASSRERGGPGTPCLRSLRGGARDVRSLCTRHPHRIMDGRRSSCLVSVSGGNRP